MTSSNQRTRLERLLDVLAETRDDDDAEASCSATEAALEAFVELELAQDDPAVVYGAVAAHLRVCPDCAERYDALLRMLSPDEEVLRPSRPFPMDRLSPPLSLQLDPNDVILPPRPTTNPRSAWATAWVQTYPQRLEALRVISPAARRKAGGQTADAKPDYQVLAPDLGDNGLVSLKLLYEGEHVALSGVLKPWDGLKGRTIRLYRLVSDHTPRLELAYESQMKAAGRLSIVGLEVGTYLLALAREDDDDLPLALIPEALWKEESDE